MTAIIKTIKSPEEGARYLSTILQNDDIFRGDPNVCERNYLKLRENADNIIKALELLVSVRVFARAGKDFADFKKKYEEAKKQLDELVGLSIITDKRVVDYYKKFKVSDVIVDLLGAYKIMMPHEKQITGPGIHVVIDATQTYIPFSMIPTIDLSALDMSVDRTQKTIDFAFKLIYEYLDIIYKEVICEPDVDVEEMSRVLTSGLVELEKALPRHKRAFNYIRGHAKVLHDTIRSYYINYESSQGNSTVLLINYIKELTKQEDATSDVKLGLKAMVIEIRKRATAAASASNDPNLRLALSMLEDLDI